MRMIILDDHPLVRKGLEMVFEDVEDIEVQGFASNGDDALTMIEDKKPDLVLVDLKLQGEHGLNVIKKARKLHPTCKYVILTSYATEEEFTNAMECDVDGYILKEALP